ncbi:MAG: hypothetical protein HRU20_17155 [Pseudomonadales bacterium]|nr:hypothetical protein [Pseudomonadales bacterium]
MEIKGIHITAYLFFGISVSYFIRYVLIDYLFSRKVVGKVCGYAVKTMHSEGQGLVTHYAPKFEYSVFGNKYTVKHYAWSSSERNVYQQYVLGSTVNMAYIPGQEDKGFFPSIPKILLVACISGVIFIATLIQILKNDLSIIGASISISALIITMLMSLKKSDDK